MTDLRSRGARLADGLAAVGRALWHGLLALLLLILVVGVPLALVYLVVRAAVHP